MEPLKIWRNGKRGGNALELGCYKVVALSGALLPFNVLRDHKQIYVDGGHNIALGKLWGWFWIEPVKETKEQQVLSDWENGFCELRDICLNYNHDSNPKYLRGIRDYLRFTEEKNKHIGRLIRNGRHMGFFTLERIGD